MIKYLSQEIGKILSKQKINLLLTKIKKMLKEKSVPQLKELMDLIVNEIIVNEEDVIVYLNIPITSEIAYNSCMSKSDHLICTIVTCSVTR